jgi:ABC-type nitrate/sulfonate/bicarbonate transport system substrate-binding protein
MKTAITKVAVVAAALVVLAGCSAPAPATDGEAEVVDITLAFVPVAGSAPIYAADQEGFFEDEGLRVTLQEVGGPAAMAALQNGEAQIASLGASVAVTAISQGLPIEVIRGSNATSEPGADGDPNVVVVMPDSGFEEAADLNGAVVATQTLSSQATIMARSSMDNLGGDSFSVQFLDVPFPDQLGALRSGSVDAAVLTEPFLTAALDEGAVPLFDFGNNAYSEGGPVGLFISRRSTRPRTPRCSRPSTVRWMRLSPGPSKTRSDCARRCPITWASRSTRRSACFSRSSRRRSRNRAWRNSSWRWFVTASSPRPPTWTPCFRSAGGGAAPRHRPVFPYRDTRRELPT